MPRINCHIPITLRITGRPDEAQLERLGETLARALAARLAQAERTIMAARPRSTRPDETAPEIVREEYQPAKHDAGAALYNVPSYNGGGQPTGVPVTPSNTPQPVPTFSQLWDAFDEHRRASHDAEALALVPDLLARMSVDQAAAHALDLAQWLLMRSEWNLAQEALSKREGVWRLRYKSPASYNLSVGDLAHDPQTLIELAEREAYAGRHSQAFRLFGLAYLFLQMQLRDLTTRREEGAGNLTGTSKRSDPKVAPELELTLSIGRPLIYSMVRDIVAQMRRILGFYRVLERAAQSTSDERLARHYSGLSLLLDIELREHYLMSGAEGLVLEASQTPIGRGGVGYTIHGAQGREEVVTPLPGTRPPEEIGFFLPYKAKMEELFAAISGQEEFLTALHSHPEIRAAFGDRRIDMNDLNQRLRLWRIMYGIFRREGGNALASLLRLMEKYLSSFTSHTEYNIRDFGVSYLSTEFPIDLAGRAVRDCGVYALTVAYEVYRTAREASPRLPVDFRLYSMPAHVVLVIFDRDDGSHYLLNNDRIYGPSPDTMLTEDIAHTYMDTFEIRFVATPLAQIDIGSTDLADQAFRAHAWERYRMSAQWELKPVPPAGPRDTRTEAERGQEAYRQFYRDIAYYERNSPRLIEQLVDLSRSLTAARTAAERHDLLVKELPNIVSRGMDLAKIFRKRTLEADVIRTNRRADRFLTFSSIYSSGDSPQHHVARFATLLLYAKHSGIALLPEQEELIAWLSKTPPFAQHLTSYTVSGLPPVF